MLAFLLQVVGLLVFVAGAAVAWGVGGLVVAVGVSLMCVGVAVEGGR